MKITAEFEDAEELLHFCVIVGSKHMPIPEKTVAEIDAMIREQPITIENRPQIKVKHKQLPLPFNGRSKCSLPSCGKIVETGLMHPITKTIYHKECYPDD